MKVLLRRSIDKLGLIGDVVNVRDGYARNYLLPEGLAAAPTEANLKAIEAEKQACLAQLASERAEAEARANMLQGKEVTITALANEEGQLYGSVGPAQIAAGLDSEGIAVEVSQIVLDEPITSLDKYEVVIEIAKDITATINVWVVPPGDSETTGDSESTNDSETTDSESDE